MLIYDYTTFDLVVITCNCVSRQKMFGEREARAVMDKLVSVVKYLHQVILISNMVFLAGMAICKSADYSEIRICNEYFMVKNAQS